MRERHPVSIDRGLIHTLGTPQFSWAMARLSVEDMLNNSKCVDDMFNNRIRDMREANMRIYVAPSTPAGAAHGNQAQQNGPRNVQISPVGNNQTQQQSSPSFVNRLGTWIVWGVGCFFLLWNCLTILTLLGWILHLLWVSFLGSSCAFEGLTTLKLTGYSCNATWGAVKDAFPVTIQKVEHVQSYPHIHLLLMAAAWAVLLFLDRIMDSPIMQNWRDCLENLPFLILAFIIIIGLVWNQSIMASFESLVCHGEESCTASTRMAGDTSEFNVKDFVKRHCKTDYLDSIGNTNQTRVVCTRGTFFQLGCDKPTNPIKECDIHCKDGFNAMKAYVNSAKTSKLGGLALVRYADRVQLFSCLVYLVFWMVSLGFVCSDIFHTYLGFISNLACIVLPKILFLWMKFRNEIAPWIFAAQLVSMSAGLFAAIQGAFNLALLTGQSMQTLLDMLNIGNISMGDTLFKMWIKYFHAPKNKYDADRAIGMFDSFVEVFLSFSGFMIINYISGIIYETNGIKASMYKLMQEFSRIYFQAHIPDHSFPVPDSDLVKKVRAATWVTAYPFIMETCRAMMHRVVFEYIEIFPGAYNNYWHYAAALMCIGLLSLVNSHGLPGWSLVAANSVVNILFVYSLCTDATLVQNNDEKRLEGARIMCANNIVESMNKHNAHIQYCWAGSYYLGEYSPWGSCPNATLTFWFNS